MAESFLATRRELWRALNWMHDTQARGVRPTIAAAVDTQWLDLDDLQALEDRGWVHYWLPTGADEMPFELANLRYRAAALAQLPFARLAGTPAAEKKLRHPFNRVLRVLHPFKIQRSPLTRVKAVMRSADVDNATLTEMAGLDLIAGIHPVPLTAFRRLPADMPLRVTKKSEMYLPEGAIEGADRYV